MEEELELTEQNVDYLFETCLYKEDPKELNFLMPVSDAVGQVGFDGFKVLNNSKKITSLFFQLMDTGEEKSYSMFGLTSEGNIWATDSESISKIILLAVANQDIERLKESIDPNFGPKYKIKRKNPDIVELTSENLINVYNDCFSVNDDENTIKVDGFKNTFNFNKDEIKKNKKKIKNFISQIGLFDSSYSYENLSFRRNGEKWSISELDIEILIGLGLATGYIEFETPKELWNSKNNTRILFVNPSLKKSDLHIN